MPITNLVECAVNLAENVTGVDIDRDGDIGVRAVPFHDCNAVPLASHTPTMHTQPRTYDGSYRRHHS